MAYGRGHCKGTKRERTPAKPWWAYDEELTIQRIEAAWAEREAIEAVLAQVPRHIREREEERT